MLDLNRVIQGVEEMLRRLIGEDVVLAIELTAEPAVVRVDAGQMEQVLVNLAVNARDAMPKGGRLTIRTSFVQDGVSRGTVEATAPVGPMVLLSVADTGIGMDAHTQALAFEPFFTTKPAGIGTGLGLSTVHGIVHQSGGRVSISSALGEGTEFRILLPRVAQATPDDPRSVAPLASFDGKETVLVAEDQEPVRQIVRIWLERRGYRVLEAVDGRSGLEVAAACVGGIDLLVTDVVMPNGSGSDLASSLRALQPDLPVIFVTGYTNDAVAQRGILEPGVRLLDKPLAEPVLLRAVREALDEARRARAGTARSEETGTPGS